MQRIDQINPERLRWSIDDRQLSVEEIARKAGMAERTLKTAIAGRAGLTFKQLKALADIFGRGVLFFLEPGPIQEEKVHSPQFRTLANQKPDLSGEVKGLIERVTRLRDVYLGLKDDDEDRPLFRPPVLTGNAPQQASIVRQWLGIDANQKQDFDRYRSAVEDCGVFVFLSTGYAGKWRFPIDSEVAGFSLYFTDCPVIAIRKQSSPARQLFTLMHELGHLLVHRASMIDEDADLYARRGREREANAFAGHLLVPDTILAQINDSHRPNEPAEYKDWLSVHTTQLGVSTETILRRLLDAQRLKQKDYDSYRQYMASLPKTKTKASGGNRWRDREPIHMFGDRYVRSVLGAVQTKQISLSKASGYLDHLKIPDVHKLEKYLAGY